MELCIHAEAPLRLTAARFSTQSTKQMPCHPSDSMTYQRCSEEGVSIIDVDRRVMTPKNKSLLHTPLGDRTSNGNNGAIIDRRDSGSHLSLVLEREGEDVWRTHNRSTE
jgi:hypothetical protein